jgi:hypothetical protein
MGLTKDHKVYRYMGNPWNEEGSAVNIRYYLQDGVGSWEYQNGILTIIASPEWTLYNWEHLETKYKDANGLGSFVKYVGYEGASYQWHHTSTKDPVYGTVMFNEATGGW